MLEQLFDKSIESYQVMQAKFEIIPFLTFLMYKKPQSMIEIGSYKGGTFFLWSKILPSDGIKLIIDLPNGPWGGQKFDYLQMGVLKNHLESLSQNTQVYFGNSSDINTINWTRERLAGKKVDFLFIDGDHSYDGVKRDYNNYKEFVSEGGVIAFHDIKNTPWHNEQGCTVWKFWEELEGQKFSIQTNDKFGGIGVLIKEGK